MVTSQRGGALRRHDSCEGDGTQAADGERLPSAWALMQQVMAWLGLGLGLGFGPTLASTLTRTLTLTLTLTLTR